MDMLARGACYYLTENAPSPKTDVLYAKTCDNAIPSEIRPYRTGVQ